MSAQPVPAIGEAFFAEDVQQYIVCWPGDEDEISPMYDGNPVFIPGIKRAYTDPKSHKFLSAVGPSGPLAGTVVLKDETSYNADNGQLIRKVDAHALVNGMFGRRGLHRKLVARGLRIVRSVDKVPAALAEGRAAWEAAQIQAAKAVLREEISRQALWEKQHGSAAPETSHSQAVVRAQEFLESIAHRAPDQPKAPSKASILATLSRIEGKVEPKPVAESTAPDDAQFQAAVSKAQELKVNLTASDWRGLALRDLDALRIVEAKLEVAESAKAGA